MGIPLVSGREFTRADDEKAALVAVVNELMAGRYWLGKNPIGERVQVQGRWMLVVGVAKDSKYESVREAPKPFFYVPLRQNFSPGAGLYIRTPLSPETVATALAREVHALDGNLALYEVITLQEQVDRSTRRMEQAALYEPIFLSLITFFYSDAGTLLGFYHCCLCRDGAAATFASDARGAGDY